MTVTVRLDRSLHHMGVLWLRFERAGCEVVGIDGKTLRVTGDQAAIDGVIERWDGEGTVTLVDGRP